MHGVYTKSILAHHSKMPSASLDPLFGRGNWVGMIQTEANHEAKPKG
jgi:hypothetical protein